MNNKKIMLTLTNKNQVEIGEEIIKEINKKDCWISTFIKLPDNYISEIVITNFGFFEEYRKLIITIYHNQIDDHPDNVIQKNEIVLKTSNVLNALSGRHILRKETGEPFEYFVIIKNKHN